MYRMYIYNVSERTNYRTWGVAKINSLPWSILYCIYMNVCVGLPGAIYVYYIYVTCVCIYTNRQQQTCMRCVYSRIYFFVRFCLPRGYTDMSVPCAQFPFICCLLKGMLFHYKHTRRVCVCVCAQVLLLLCPTTSPRHHVYDNVYTLYCNCTSGGVSEM